MNSKRETLKKILSTMDEDTKRKLKALLDGLPENNKDETQIVVDSLTEGLKGDGFSFCISIMDDKSCSGATCLSMEHKGNAPRLLAAMEKQVEDLKAKLSEEA